MVISRILDSFYRREIHLANLEDPTQVQFIRGYDKEYLLKAQNVIGKRLIKVFYISQTRCFLCECDEYCGEYFVGVFHV